MVCAHRVDDNTNTISTAHNSRTFAMCHASKIAKNRWHTLYAVALEEVEAVHKEYEGIVGVIRGVTGSV